MDRLSHRLTGVIGGTAIACLLVSTNAFATEYWTDTGSCARSVGWDYEVTCTSYAGSYSMAQYDPYPYYWTAITGAADFITTDKSANPWVVDSSGIVYYGYVTSSITWQSIDTGAGITFKTVAAGDPANSRDDVWATDTSGNVYVWTGYVNGSTVETGYWVGVGQSFTHGAAKVAMFNETLSNTLSSPAGCTTLHTPWVLDGAGQVWKYEYSNYGSCTASSSCTGGCWVYQSNAAGYDIASNDLVLGTDRNVYQWNPSNNTWPELTGPSLGTGVTIRGIGGQIGSGAGALYLFDSNSAVWYGHE